MRQILLQVLAVHWTALFAAMAAACAAEPGAGIRAPLVLLGLAAAQHGGTLTATLFAMAFAVVSLLFFWALVESIFGADFGGRRGRLQLRLAFAAAALVLTLLLMMAALQPMPGLFPAVECLIAVNLLSYLAVCVEQWIGEAAGGASVELREAARRMALDAANQSLLSNLSGRAGEEPEWRR